MKILKLVKKFNWIDLILLLIIVIIGGVVLFSFYRKAEYVNIKVKVTDQEVLTAKNLPLNWYADKFEVGDVEKDLIGKNLTEIKSIESYNTDSLHKTVYLNLKVRAVYDSRTKLYSAKGKSLIFGMPLRFNFSKITCDTIVTDFPNSQFSDNYHEDYATATGIIRAYDSPVAKPIEPAILISINKGDKIFDSNNQLLAEVLEINVNPAQQVVQTINGDLLLKYNPLFKDATIKVKLKTKTYKNEIYMFDNIPLKIGERIPLNFNKVSVFPSIIAIN